MQPVELDLSRVQGHDAGRDARADRVPAHRRAAVLPDARARTASTGSGCSRRRAPIAARARAGDRHAGRRTLPALFVGAAWETLLDGNVRTLIERELLLPFLQRQRWFGGKARAARAARFVDWGAAAPRPAADVPHDRRGRVTRTATREQYFLPLTVCTRRRREGTRGALAARGPGARHRRAQGRHVRRLARRPLRARRCSTRSSAGADADQARQRPRRQDRGLRRAPRRADDGLRVRACRREQSNTSIVYGDRLILKLFRRLEPGSIPTSRSAGSSPRQVGFTRVPAVAGALEYDAAGDEPATLGDGPAARREPGRRVDARDSTSCGRFYDDVAGGSRRSSDAPRALHRARRSRQMPRRRSPRGDGRVPRHRAKRSGGAPRRCTWRSPRTDATPAFAPEPFTTRRRRRRSARGRRRRRRSRRSQTLRPSAGSSAAALGRRDTAARRSCCSRAIRCSSGFDPRRRFEFVASKIRVHGDYHLGQVLWSEGDFYMLDFEGEPARPIEERRLQSSRR